MLNFKILSSPGGTYYTIYCEELKYSILRETVSIKYHITDDDIVKMVSEYNGYCAGMYHIIYFNDKADAEKFMDVLIGYEIAFNL